MARYLNRKNTIIYENRYRRKIIRSLNVFIRWNLGIEELGMNSSLKIFYNFFKFGTKISLSVLNSFFFTLALIYSFNPSIVHSQSTIVFDEPDLRNVGKNLEYLEDPGGDLKISDILSEPYRSRFQPHDSDYFKKPASNSYFWFRFRVKNLTKEDLWLRFGRSNVWLL